MMPDDDLEQLFAQAAVQRAVPSDGLITRIQADAAALQPKARVAAVAPSRGWLSGVADWFGGGMSLAGMSAAALAGLFLGIAQPVPVVALTEMLRGSTTLDSLELLPTGGALWTME
jgi:hypothetical protein